MRKFNFNIFAIQKTLKYPFNLTGPFEKIVRQFNAEFNLILQCRIKFHKIFIKVMKPQAVGLGPSGVILVWGSWNAYCFLLISSKS